MTPEQIREQMTGRKTERRAYRELTGGSMPANWQRHTVDANNTAKINGQRAQDDMAAIHAGWLRAKYAWIFMLGLAAGYVLGRWVAPWIFGV